MLLLLSPPPSPFVSWFITLSSPPSIPSSICLNTLLLNHPSQHKRHAQATTKYVELIIVADNREVSRGHTVSITSPSSADLCSKGVQGSHT